MNTSDFTENRFLKLIDNIDQRGTSLSDGVPFSPFRPFEDLSMKERAAVIRIGVLNGLRDLESIRSKYNEYADGGSIHIKPENRGKFTALKERTGHSAINGYLRSIAEGTIKRLNLLHNTPSYKNSNWLRKKYKDAHIRVVDIDENGNAVFNHTFDSGGPEEVLERVNSSNADFVQRLKDPNRQTIEDWEIPGNIATHKLSVGTDELGNNYIYPEVQNIDGKLVDFTRPPYAPWIGMAAAEERGDTVRINNLDDAIRFTETYKQYYPSFNYSSGGKIHIKPLNRGKFTALKKRTGHSASWFKAHGTPALKKMATFALNARKWKHEDGGILFDEGGHKFSDTPVGRAMQRQYDLEQSELAPAIMINEDEAVKTKSLPEVVVYGSNWKNDLLKKLPKPVVGGIMNTARTAHWTGKIELPSFYGLTKNADNYDDPAVAALFDYARQEEFMKNKGYHRVDDYDYGLVNRAAKRHGYPPIYQLNGKDAISRDSLDVLTNDRTFFIDFGNGPEKVSVNVPFDDANWYPTALYKHKDRNEYYKKGWDLEDFGSYDNEGGVNYKGTSETGNTYPSYMQGLANMLDVVGHPYVRRTPIIAMPELDGFIWDKDTKTFTKPPVEMAMGGRLKHKNKKNKGS